MSRHDRNESISRGEDPESGAKPRPGADETPQERTPRVDRVIDERMRGLDDGARSDRAAVDRLVRGTDERPAGNAPARDGDSPGAAPEAGDAN